MQTSFPPGLKETARSGTTSQAGTRNAEDEARTALQEWVSHLRRYDVRARQRAARALRDYGPAAVEPLCAALHDRDESVRVAAAESLGMIGDDRAVQPL